MVKLTDREKKSIKQKYDKIVKLGTDTGMPVSKVKKLLSENFTDNLSDLYSRAEEKKSKFKGGVPGGFDRYFSKEMNKAEKLIKQEKRKMQEGVYDPKKDKLVRKGPRGNKRFI